MYVYKDKNRRGKALFEITEYSLKINGAEYFEDDIKEIRVVGSLGKIFPVRKFFDRIDELCELPIAGELYGTVEIKTKEREYVFGKVFGIMETAIVLKRFYPLTYIGYKFRNKERKYLFDGELDEKELSDENYTVIFVFKEGKKIRQKDIKIIADKWVKKCGYRLCSENEASSYTMYRYSSDSEEWIANFDDSIENLNIHGLVEQLKSYSQEFEGMAVVSVGVYDKKALLVGYAKSGEGMKFFVYDKNEEFKESLDYNDKIISNDYEVLEKLRKNEKYSVEEIIKSDDITFDEKIERLAYVFGIEKRFMKIGFYGLTYLSDVSKYYFGLGYDIFEERIRINEKEINEIFRVMCDGMPAFDLYKSGNIIKNGEDYEISYLNIGDFSRGLAFFISSGEIHDMMMENIRGGECNIDVKDLRLIKLKDEIDTPEKFENSDSPYEEIALEGEFKRVWGRYSYLFEGTDIMIPRGLIRNENAVKNEYERKILNFFTEKCKITFKFKLVSDKPLRENIEIFAGPMLNMHCGYAKKSVPFIK